MALGTIALMAIVGVGAYAAARSRKKGPRRLLNKACAELLYTSVDAYTAWAQQTLRPIYLRANNAVAVTGKGKPIDLAVGFAGKAARTEKGAKKIQLFAESSFSVPNVKLGTAVSALPDGSSLIALPPENASALEFSMAITESGTALPNFEKSKAELKSLSKAVGPTIVDQIKAFFTPKP